MTPALFIKAFLLGILMASPIGPVGLLCLKKNAATDRWSGLFTALGMAVAYGIISFCVLFGLTKVSGFLEEWRCPLEIVAGLALILMGWRGLKFPDSSENGSPGKKKYLGDFTSSFAMTLFNPVPFATFAVILTTFKILKDGQLDLVSDIEFSLLVFLGTLAFWSLVNHILHLVKKRSTTDLCRWISRGAAVALIIFGSFIFLAGVWLAITILAPGGAT